MAEQEPEFGDFQIRPDQDRKFKCGIVKVGRATLLTADSRVEHGAPWSDITVLLMPANAIP